MRNTPIARELIDKTIEDFHITDFAKATIREVKAIADSKKTPTFATAIERDSNDKMK